MTHRAPQEILRVLVEVAGRLDVAFGLGRFSIRLGDFRVVAAREEVEAGLPAVAEALSADGALRDGVVASHGSAERHATVRHFADAASNTRAELATGGGTHLVDLACVGGVLGG